MLTEHGGFLLVDANTVNLRVHNGLYPTSFYDCHHELHRALHHFLPFISIDFFRSDVFRWSQLFIQDWGKKKSIAHCGNDSGCLEISSSSRLRVDLSYACSPLTNIHIFGLQALEMYVFSCIKLLPKLCWLEVTRQISKCVSGSGCNKDNLMFPSYVFCTNILELHSIKHYCRLLLET